MSRNIFNLDITKQILMTVEPVLPLLHTLWPLGSYFLSLAPSLTGTTERVCLIQGTVEALNGVHNFIAEKVREMPQSAQKPEPVSILQPQTTVNPDRVKQVRGCVYSW